MSIDIINKDECGIFINGSFEQEKQDKYRKQCFEEKKARNKALIDKYNKKIDDDFNAYNAKIYEENLIIEQSNDTLSDEDKQPLKEYKTEKEPYRIFKDENYNEDSENKNNAHYGLRYTELIPILINGVNQLSEKNKELENKVNSIESKNTELENELVKMKEILGKLVEKIGLK